MKKITITVDDDIWYALRMKSIHTKKDIPLVVADILKTYINGQKKD